jgi:hypothetical protein
LGGERALHHAVRGHEPLHDRVVDPGIQVDEVDVGEALLAGEGFGGLAGDGIGGVGGTGLVALAAPGVMVRQGSP